MSRTSENFDVVKNDRIKQCIYGILNRNRLTPVKLSLNESGLYFILSSGLEVWIDKCEIVMKCVGFSKEMSINKWLTSTTKQIDDSGLSGGWWEISYKPAFVAIDGLIRGPQKMKSILESAASELWRDKAEGGGDDLDGKSIQVWAASCQNLPREIEIDLHNELESMLLESYIEGIATYKFD